MKTKAGNLVWLEVENLACDESDSLASIASILTKKALRWA